MEPLGPTCDSDRLRKCELNDRLGRGVGGEHADHVGRTEIAAMGVEVAIWPVVDYFVGEREALLRGEHRSGITHRHAIPEQLARPHQRSGEIDRAEDDHPRRRGEALDEDADALLPSFSVRAVVAGAGETGGKLAFGVTGHDAVEFGVTERAEWVVCRTQDSMCRWGW